MKKLEKELNLTLTKEEVDSILDELMPSYYDTYNIHLLKWNKIFDDISGKTSLLTMLRKYFPGQFEYKDEEITIEKKSSHELSIKNEATVLGSIDLKNSQLGVGERKIPITNVDGEVTLDTSRFLKPYDKLIYKINYQRQSLTFAESQ